MKRIGILGVGGVGGFVAAALLRKYATDKSVEVVLICRDETKEAIEKNGFRFQKGDEAIERFMPDMVEDDPENIGRLDVMIIATKSYDLEKAIKRYSSCVDHDSVVIPLQNMLYAKQTILEAVTLKAEILDACIYLISKVVEPGYVCHVGGPGMIKIGGGSGEKHESIVEFLGDAGLDVEYDENIQTAIWKKYLFVSPIAGLTTAFRVTLGELVKDPDLKARRIGMMNEIRTLASSEKIEISDEDFDETIALIHQFPDEAKSSMQLDFEKKKRQTEKFFMVNYFINACGRAEIPCPQYDSVNKVIKGFFKKK